jgi:hypothetical protein
MIPNLLNTILGIALVYCAILAPGALTGSVWPLFGTGIGIVVLALWARLGDRLKWFNVVNPVLGAALVVLGFLGSVTPIHPLVMFWWVFWAGIIVAVLAFWSALYTRDATAGAP